tara:strand:- start:27143 stop:28282 length:1140 start_codon:yes stop_codon:yes gene_type:complete
MSDYCWGLQQLGHDVTVVCNNATYLGESGQGPNGESVVRALHLKGSFQNGVQLLQDSGARQAVDEWNCQILTKFTETTQWDGLLIGNLDLLGPELLIHLLSTGIPTIHHVGFVSPPFPANAISPTPNYCIAGASLAVQRSLAAAGFSAQPEHVVYPGARIELMGQQFTGRMLPAPLGDSTQTVRALGTSAKPLKVCFAGLLMASKGAHTLVEAIIKLNQQGVAVQATLSGAAFQAGYQEKLKNMLAEAGLSSTVTFTGNLNRPQLARMFSLHHVGVFPSIYPEAFGITGAEIQASGLVLVSSGVGGSAELIENGVTGLTFQTGDAQDLAAKLFDLSQHPEKMIRLARNGQQRIRDRFSVVSSTTKLERMFYDLQKKLKH